MEVVSSSETSVSYRNIIQRHNPKDLYLNSVNFVTNVVFNCCFVSKY